MLKLGYNEYVTQGGDWGTHISRSLALLYPQHCKATHLNYEGADPPSWLHHPLLALRYALTPATEYERQGVARSRWFQGDGYGYNAEQSTRPQTLGYGLADSPVAPHNVDGRANKIDRHGMRVYTPGVKLGFSRFPMDLSIVPSAWLRTLGEVVFERVHESGGHFAAWERPEELVADVRAMYGRGGGAFDVVKGRSGYAS
ncbi:putative epoxide hydrolase protein [Eutypa lata UCREL1]|uniref:Putative epoxide hydrolase protein n=1 Tax=Eutypa lata (strain UCR-EL1) TaxID=1287681 RepID=M7T370_EUTLA|nr:putative epoxide hydrolase protein [Eutypa lata UCREL1]